MTHLERKSDTKKLVMKQNHSKNNSKLDSNKNIYFFLFSLVAINVFLYRASQSYEHKDTSHYHAV